MNDGSITLKVENKLHKNIRYFIIGFSVVVYALVMLLHELPAMNDIPAFVSYLPAFNAFVNGTSFILLILAFVFIKNGMVTWHKRMNTTAMILAVVFLLSYVANHTFSGDTIYGGAFTNLYYFILASHILLAALSLPMILFSYAYGFYDLRTQHKKWVRWTYPLWLYVTFTGVLVYLFLAPYYA